MKRFEGLLCLLLTLAVPALPQQSPDFTGTYILKSLTRSDSSRTITPDSLPQSEQILKVTQHSSSIEFSYIFANGSGLVRTYKFDGSDSTNPGFDGTSEIDRTSLKDGAITINSKRKAPGPQNDKMLYFISKWELSRDLKTLTLHRWFHVQGGHPAGDTLTAIYLRQ